MSFTKSLLNQSFWLPGVSRGLKMLGVRVIDLMLRSLSLKIRRSLDNLVFARFWRS